MIRLDSRRGRTRRDGEPWLTPAVDFSVVQVREPERAQFAACDRCGELLEVRIHHLYGQLEERCPSCRSPWALVPRRVMPPPPVKEKRAVRPRHAIEERRAIVLSAIPTHPEHAKTVREIADALGLDYFRVDADLRGLHRAGAVRFAKRPELVRGGHSERRLVEVKTVWRAA